MLTRGILSLVLGASLTCIAALSSHSAQNSGTPTKDAPPAVYVDEGACPFECCTYREWTVDKPVTVFDRPNGNVIAHLSKGERVTALTGEVISKPFPMTAKGDIPDTPIKSGDTFYVLHPYGEGAWAVWFRGKKITVEEDYFSEDPQVQLWWWAKIKDSRGKIGWALSEKNNFGNQDACG